MFFCGSVFLSVDDFLNIDLTVWETVCYVWRGNLMQVKCHMWTTKCDFFVSIYIKFAV